MTLSSVPEIACHQRILRVTLQNHLYTHATSYSVPSLTSRQAITADLYSQKLELVQQALKQESVLFKCEGVYFLHDIAWQLHRLII